MLCKSNFLFTFTSHWRPCRHEAIVQWCVQTLLFSLSTSRPPPPPTTCLVSRWGSSPPSPPETSARCTNPLSPGGATYLQVHAVTCHSKFSLILSAKENSCMDSKETHADLLFCSNLNILLIFSHGQLSYYLDFPVSRLLSHSLSGCSFFSFPF